MLILSTDLDELSNTPGFHNYLYLFVCISREVVIFFYFASETAAARDTSLQTNVSDLFLKMFFF